MQRIIIGLGLILVVLGLLWPLLTKLPFGRLPGDITIQGENYVVKLPLMTCLILSVLLSLVLYLVRR
ncbi:MAG: DUF2905 domain-containing protein [Kiritimatiellae bacterium]|nr:DUF2905 domain-containing protein [Kiritimatiellia bacterium]